MRHAPLPGVLVSDAPESVAATASDRQGRGRRGDEKGANPPRSAGSWPRCQAKNGKRDACMKNCIARAARWRTAFGNPPPPAICRPHQHGLPAQQSEAALLLLGRVPADGGSAKIRFTRDGAGPGAALDPRAEGAEDRGPDPGYGAQGVGLAGGRLPLCGLVPAGLCPAPRRTPAVLNKAEKSCPPRWRGESVRERNKPDRYKLDLFKGPTERIRDFAARPPSRSGRAASLATLVAPN